MKPNLKQWIWTKEPAAYRITDDALEIVTTPCTDLWQRTYYHFQKDCATALQTKTDDQFFSFIVKTDFSDSRCRFDQCGIIIYLDSENWLKASVEYENEESRHLGSVVTNNGYSDWATTEIPYDVTSIWYRLSRRKDDYRIESSEDGVRWKQMRICHLQKGAGTVFFGVYACSPGNASFTARISDMAITACAWDAH